jgi:hypothetical protein
MLWSGGLTLVVLLILGGAVYLTVSRALAAGGTAVLRDRAGDVTRFVSGSGPGPGPGPGRSPIGVSFGGRGSGTLALVVKPEAACSGSIPTTPAGDPLQVGIEAARNGVVDVRTAEVDDIPVRILPGHPAR